MPAQIKAAEDVHRSLIATALAVGGTITGEHGVGTAKAVRIIISSIYILLMCVCVCDY